MKLLLRANMLSNCFKDTAFKIAFIYACFSVLWILFSDQILLRFVKDAIFLTTSSKRAVMAGSF